MSNASAQTFVVHYSRVDDLLQEVQRETPSVPLILRIERRTPAYAGWCAWGVLLTAQTGTTIHAAWVQVGKSQIVMVTPYRQQEMERTLQTLYECLVTYVKQRGFVVRPGFYEVTLGVYRQSAVLPEEVCVPPGKGAHS
jgi:hypothetical protein